MEVVQVIEDTFSYLVMVRLADTDFAPLRWELDKPDWLAVSRQRFYLRLPPEKLILMDS